MTQRLADLIAATRRSARGTLQLRARVERLREQSPHFALGSKLRPAVDRRWQSAVYLLSGHPALWAVLRGRVIERQSPGAAARELLDDPSTCLTASERELLDWTVHLSGDGSQPEPPFPRALQREPSLRQRWIDAVRLRRGIAASTTAPGDLMGAFGDAARAGSTR